MADPCPLLFYPEIKSQLYITSIDIETTPHFRTSRRSTLASSTRSCCRASSCRTSCSTWSAAAQALTTRAPSCGDSASRTRGSCPRRSTGTSTPYSRVQRRSAGASSPASSSSLTTSERWVDREEEIELHDEPQNHNF